jgi:hypothetical protein
MSLNDSGGYLGLNFHQLTDLNINSNSIVFLNKKSSLAFFNNVLKRKECFEKTIILHNMLNLPL